MPELSVPAWAQTLGISKVAAYKRIKNGKVTRNPNGKIDVEAAAAEWDYKKDPIRATHRPAPGRDFVSTVDASVTIPPAPQATVTSPVAPPAFTAVPLAPYAPPQVDTVPKDGKSLANAQRARAWLAVKRDKLLLDEIEGRLVDATEVRQVIVARAQAEREALLNWPSRTSPTLAATLGVDERTLHLALDKEVRRFLSERSGPQGGANAA